MFDEIWEEIELLESLGKEAQANDLLEIHDAIVAHLPQNEIDELVRHYCKHWNTSVPNGVMATN